MTPQGLVKVVIQCFVCGGMGPSQASEAIILRTRAYGESDKIVTFLTADVGKLTGIAKGAKNSRRRFANCLDPFTRVRVHFRTKAGASLAFMESCDLLEPVGSLTDPAKFAYGSYLVELVDQLTAEGQPIRELYELLAEGLDAVRHGPATATFLRSFELRLLHHAGYEPQLQDCTRCHAGVFSDAGVFLDPTHGSVVCGRCRDAAESLVPIAGVTLAALTALKPLPLAEARVRRFPNATAAEAAQVMSRLLALHLARPLRSVKLIAALQ
jgi:DNA repair protein RecO (recombination protein O)